MTNVLMGILKKPGGDILKMTCLNVRNVTATVTVINAITIRPLLTLGYPWTSTVNTRVEVCVRNVRTTQRASTVKLVRRGISDQSVYPLMHLTLVYLVNVEMILGILEIVRQRAVSVSARRRSVAPRIVPSAH